LTTRNRADARRSSPVRRWRRRRPGDGWGTARATAAPAPWPGCRRGRCRR
jgi:hypothetical protein